MLRKKTNNVILSFEDRKQITAFFSLLIQIDRRNIKEGKSKRNRKTKVKDKTDGSQMCGPFLMDISIRLLMAIKDISNLMQICILTNIK